MGNTPTTYLTKYTHYKAKIQPSILNLELSNTSLEKDDNDDGDVSYSPYYNIHMTKEQLDAELEEYMADTRT